MFLWQDQKLAGHINYDCFLLLLCSCQQIIFRLVSSPIVLFIVHYGGFVIGLGSFLGHGSHVFFGAPEKL